MADAILNIDKLCVSFTKNNIENVIVKDLSFQVNRGETLAILGESGSGKTLTALAIMQLIHLIPNCKCSGTINFKVQDATYNLVNTDSKMAQLICGKHIGFIFQDALSALNPVYTCGTQIVENIKLNLEYNTESAKALALEWLSKVQLEPANLFFNKYPHELSGGQLQRIMIAMVMCTKPELIIADEPTSALDAITQSEILNLIITLQKQSNTSCIFISHDMSVVKKIAQQVLVMKHGVLMENNTVDNVFENPESLYTKALTACVPPIQVKLKSLPIIESFDNNDAYQPIIISEKDQIITNTILEKNEIVFEINNVSYSYNTSNFWQRTSTNAALQNINLRIKSNQITGIVGLSGSGKSTLAKILLGVLQPSHGSVSYLQQSLQTYIKNNKKSFHKNIQLISQNPYQSFNPRITIGAALMEPMLIHDLHKDDANRKTEAINLLKKVQLTETDFDKYPHQLSGGQRQRAAIARALAFQPQVLICDECVSALDVSVQAQILNLIKHLQEEMQLTIVFISHNLPVIKFLCDSVVVMEHGTIIEQNAALAVFTNPQTNFTKLLLQASS